MSTEMQIPSPPTISALLNPPIPQVADAETLAKYVVVTLATLKRLGETRVSFYMTEEAGRIIGEILKKRFGMKFKLVSSSSMKPPYIYIALSKGDVYIEVAETRKSKRHWFVPVKKFVDALNALADRFEAKKKPRKEERVPEKPERVLKAVIDSMEVHIEEWEEILRELGEEPEKI